MTLTLHLEEKFWLDLNNEDFAQVGVQRNRSCLHSTQIASSPKNSHNLKLEALEEEDRRNNGPWSWNSEPWINKQLWQISCDQQKHVVKSQLDTFWMPA